MITVWFKMPWSKFRKCDFKITHCTFTDDDQEIYKVSKRNVHICTAIFLWELNHLYYTWIWWKPLGTIFWRILIQHIPLNMCIYHNSRSKPLDLVEHVQLIGSSCFFWCFWQINQSMTNLADRKIVHYDQCEM